MNHALRDECLARLAARGEIAVRDSREDEHQGDQRNEYDRTSKQRHRVGVIYRIDSFRALMGE